MYVRGLSTRDIDATLTDETGKPLLSRSAASRLTESLYQEYEAFTKRDLSELDLDLLFIDGVYESVGLHLAIARCFPRADRQRCIAHKLRNLGAKLPQEATICKTVLGKVKAVYEAPDRAAADVAASTIVEEGSRVYPTMVECFLDDLDACITHLAYPMGHRKFIRTTNQLERTLLEEKRRTKVMPQHANERGAIKLVFGVVVRVSTTWVRVRMSKIELSHLRNVRQLKAAQQDKHYISYRLAT